MANGFVRVFGVINLTSSLTFFLPTSHPHPVLAGLSPQSRTTGLTSASSPKSIVLVDHTGRRLPSSTYSQSERFKLAEHSFLSGGSSSPRTNIQHTLHHDKSKRTPLSDKEELERLLEESVVGIPDEKQSSSTFTISSPTSASSSSSSSSKPLSPPTTMSPSQPNSSRQHARRPSYMQATQQELKRQAELREMQAAREGRKAEELAKSTRRIGGKTNTDLYLQQQSDLESRRLEKLEKEEAERRAERARFLARFIEQTPPPPQPSQSTSNTGESATTPRARPPLVKELSFSYASGSQTARSSTLSPSAPPSTLANSALLQQELEKREGVILADTRQTTNVEYDTDLRESDEDEDENEESDDDENDIDDETRANTLANSSKHPTTKFVTTSSSNNQPSQHHHHHHALSPKVNHPHTLSITVTPDVTNDHDLDVKRSMPTTVAEIYDPTVGRLLSRHEGGFNDNGRTGLDFLLESTRVKRAMRNKKTKLAVANISTGFGRMTEAQIERSMENLERQRLREAQQANQPKPMGFGGGGGGGGGGGSHLHNDRDNHGSAPPKKNFFPSLWKRITGS